MDTLKWKPDWAKAREAFQSWWEHRGLALCVLAPRDKPVEDIGPVPLAETKADAAEVF